MARRKKEKKPIYGVALCAASPNVVTVRSTSSCPLFFPSSPHNFQGSLCLSLSLSYGVAQSVHREIFRNFRATARNRVPLPPYSRSKSALMVVVYGKMWCQGWGGMHFYFLRLPASCDGDHRLMTDMRRPFWRGVGGDAIDERGHERVGYQNEAEMLFGYLICISATNSALRTEHAVYAYAVLFCIHVKRFGL